mgnify:CR=1 FL=1
MPAPTPTPAAPPVDPNTPAVVDPTEQDPPADPPGPGTGLEDPMLSSLIEDIKVVVADPPAPEIKEVNVDAPPPGDPPPAAPAKRTKKKLEIVVDTPPAPPAPAAPVEPAPPAPAPVADPDPDAEYIKSLTEEQREELAEADFAERTLGGKYAGQKKKLLDSYRAVDKFATENPDAKPEDEEFQKILRAKPVITGADAKKVIRGMAAEEVEQRLVAKDKTPDKLAEIERTQRAMQAEPEIQSVVQQVSAGIHELNLADAELGPVAKALAEKPFSEVVKEFPLEAEILKQERHVGAALSYHYNKLSRGLIDFDERNPAHVDLSKFIVEQCGLLKQKEAKVNGAAFLTRDEMAAYIEANPKAKRETLTSGPNKGDYVVDGKYWTLGHPKINEMLAHRAVIRAKDRIKTEHERAVSMGYERKKAGAAAVPPNTTPEPTPIESVSHRSRPAPGAAVTPKPAVQSEGLDVASTFL